MAQNLKDQIIDAFIARFNEEGPALRLSEVATALHISKKTIYKVFPSKSSIYDTIIEKATAEIDARKEEIMTSNESTKEKLLDLVRAPQFGLETQPQCRQIVRSSWQPGASRISYRQKAKGNVQRELSGVCDEKQLVAFEETRGPQQSVHAPVETHQRAVRVCFVLRLGALEYRRGNL
jgi:AcrR family transcriptional regulator